MDEVNLRFDKFESILGQISAFPKSKRPYIELLILGEELSIIYEPTKRGLFGNVWEDESSKGGTKYILTSARLLGNHYSKIVEEKEEKERKEAVITYLPIFEIALGEFKNAEDASKKNEIFITRPYDDTPRFDPGPFGLP